MPILKYEAGCIRIKALYKFFFLLKQAMILKWCKWEMSFSTKLGLFGYKTFGWKQSVYFDPYTYMINIA